MMGTCQIIGDSGYVWFLKCDSLRKGQVCSSTGELGKRTWPLLGMLESALIETKLCERYIVENSIEGFCNIHGASSFYGLLLVNLVLLDMKENHLFPNGYPDIKKQQDRKIVTSHFTSGMFTHAHQQQVDLQKYTASGTTFLNQRGKKKGSPLSIQYYSII